MDDWQVRVRRELIDLQEKFERLEAFLNSDKVTTITDFQVLLLELQRLVMKEYIHILVRRLSPVPKGLEQMDPLGKVAHEAYCEEIGGNSPIMKWENLSEDTKKGWEASAKAVGDKVMNKTVDAIADSVEEAAKQGFEEAITWIPQEE